MKFDYDALAALASVLRTGSFDAAATALGLTQPAVSLRIKRLEDRVGSILVTRARPCMATPTGARLMRHAEEVGLLEQTLARDLGALPGEADRPLRLAVNADSLATWVLPALTEGQGFLFELTLDDQDHSADWLKRGEVSGAITSHGAPIPGCDATALGALPYVATCSPAFRARWFADGLTAEALSHAPCLTFNRKDTLQAAWAERLLGRRIALPTHFLPSSHDFVTAARLGLGWGMNPRALVEADLAAGHLVDLAPGQTQSTPLTWQVARQIALALAPLTRALRHQAAAHLLQNS
ncbi:LysR family transcriptional regulator ArgP [Nioella nitratireducens]|uniref:LysR family transcriptional regulator ArgP n=1 Tax=Nioella nitratireducens TaxID=1287720 RepID=UPI0008FD49F1|nr:LysR family transcriptional regulator ArgP [Nioella nitratireducens]